ncbi:hypothetical protein PT974_11038 [Cladobotryum mycophilum]|uniref:Uncharacterized protein n=1 Tax=Cladobotryum mycophilum TaxID=491253 RepID=A0ABR0SBG4_9HYPO
MTNAVSTLRNGCHNQENTIPANPDIAGIGILAAFAGTTYVTVFILVVYGLFIYDPTQDTITQQRYADGQGFRPNPIDLYTVYLRQKLFRGLAFCCSPIRRWMPAGSRWFNDPAEQARLRDFFHTLIRRVCDGHLAAGYVALISGFGSMSSDNVTAYHWQILVKCVWHSAITHFAGLKFLRLSLSSRLLERCWRICSTLVLIGLLIAALVPNMFPLEDDFFVKCFWEDLLSKGNLTGVEDLGDEKVNKVIATDAFVPNLLSILFLGFTFVMRCIEISPMASRGVFVSLKGWISNSAADVLSRLWWEGDEWYHNWWHHAFIRPLSILFLMGRLYKDFFESMLTQLFGILVSTAWGTLGLYEKRFTTNDTPEGDNKWGFSQITAVMVPAVPLLFILHAFCESKDKSSSAETGGDGQPMASEGHTEPPSPAPATTPPLQTIPDPRHTESDSAVPYTGSKDVLLWIDYKAYSNSYWRPWVSLLVALYNVAGAVNLLSQFWSIRGIHWSLLNMIPWYIAGQLSVIFLFILFSANLEWLLKDIDLSSSMISRSNILRLFNVISFAGFTTWAFFSCAGTFYLLAPWSNWFDQHNLGFMNLFSLFGQFVGFKHVPKGILALWGVMLGLAVAYQVTCFIVCSKPWQWRLGCSSKARDDSIELSALDEM